MTSRHLRHILFIRSQSLGPARTPGQGRTQRHKSQVTGIIGGISEAANHTPLPQYCSLFSLTLDISGLHFSLCVCSVLVSRNTPAHSACICLLLPLHCHHQCCDFSIQAPRLPSLRTQAVFPAPEPTVP